MVVKVNASHTICVWMNQVILNVSILQAGADASQSMNDVTERVKKVTDKVKGITGVTCELQSAGVRPHMVMKQEEGASSKKMERVQEGHEAYAYLVIKVPFGTAKLNPIAQVVAEVGGSLSARYGLTDAVRADEEAVLRFKLLDIAVKQCRQLLSYPSGLERSGLSITPSRVYYHSQETGSAVGAYKMSERSAVESSDNEVGFDLDAIYTSENAPRMNLSDSVEVAFDVEGYSLSEPS